MEEKKKEVGEEARAAIVERERESLNGAEAAGNPLNIRENCNSALGFATFSF